MRIYLRGPHLGPIRTTLWSSARRKTKRAPATTPVSVLLGIVANRHDDAKGRVHFDLVPIGGDELVDATGNGDHPGPVTGKPTGDPIPLDFGRASDIADGMRVALI